MQLAAVMVEVYLCSETPERRRQLGCDDESKAARKMSCQYATQNVCAFHWKTSKQAWALYPGGATRQRLLVEVIYSQVQMMARCAKSPDARSASHEKRNGETVEIKNK